MIELHENLVFLSEEEFSNIENDYVIIIYGGFNLRTNEIYGVFAPSNYNADEFTYSNGKFIVNNVRVKPDTAYTEHVINAVRNSTRRPPGLYDNATRRWVGDAVLHSDIDQQGRISIYLANNLGNPRIKFGANIQPHVKTAVLLNQESIDRIEQKTSTVTLLEEGAVAVSYVLVGVGVDFPRYLTRNTVRARTLDTPFYKAYKMPTAKLPSGLLNDFNITLTRNQLDIKDMAESLSKTTFTDPRLHEDQIDAVRVHMATNLGFVNALQTGDGKTIATLVGLEQRSLSRPNHRALVVLEAAVRGQWRNEATNWLDDEWEIVTITSRKQADELQEALDHQKEHGGKLLILCSYTLTADVEEEEQRSQLGQILAETSFDDVILDEGRTVRGQNKTARALWHIRDNSEVGVVLCATPVLKSVVDLGALMAWARNDPSIRGDHLKDLFDFSESDDKLALLSDWYDWWGPTLVRSTTSRDKRSDAMVRPSVKTVVKVVTPTAFEVQISTQILGKIKETLQDVIDAYRRAGGGLTVEEEKQLRGSILATQSVARMAASDVRILANSDSTIAHLLRAEGAFDFPHGFVPAKMEAAADFCVKANEPVVVFTEYQDTAKGLRDLLDSKGVKVSLFIGGGGAKREEELEKFKNGDSDVLVATSAAERGLNLQNAKHVLHYDHKFTPDAFFQRTGRVTRIGSVYTEVEATFFVTENTVDERVFSVAVARAGLAGATAAKSAEDFNESDHAAMLKTLVKHASPVRLANRGQVSQLELTEALVS